MARLKVGWMGGGGPGCVFWGGGGGGQLDGKWIICSNPLIQESWCSYYRGGFVGGFVQS